MASKKINLFNLEDITEELSANFFTEINKSFDISNLKSALRYLKEEIKTSIKKDIEVEIFLEKELYMYVFLTINFPEKPFPHISDNYSLTGLIEMPNIEKFDPQSFCLELMSFDLFQYSNAFNDLKTTKNLFKSIQKLESLFEIELLEKCKSTKFYPYLNSIKEDFYELRYNKSYFIFSSLLNTSSFIKNKENLDLLIFSIYCNEETVTIRLIDEYIVIGIENFINYDIHTLKNYILSLSYTLNINIPDIKTFKQTLHLKSLEIY